MFDKMPSMLLSSVLLILATLSVCGSSTTTITAPLSINPDENWDGIDGSWSSFTLRVGTPAQYVRTFVSFASYQTWVVLPQGCQTAADEGACANARGGLFNQTASSTWNQIGIYDLWVEDSMGYDGNAIYGYDTVGLGGLGEGGPTLLNTTVGGFAVDDFYLGVLGINPKPTNFTSFNEPSTSYMTLLKEQGHIPSVSFGYTAGASYRFDGVLASLTLGGYDTSKFIDNNVTFIFSPNNERDVLVSLQGITTPSQTPSSPTATSLLPQPIYMYIDATLPQIWLPLEACEAFEVEFGLVYDNTTELYLVNDTLHQQLLSRDANITFTIGQGLTGGDTVQIVLPYAAFDLQAQAPYQGLDNTTYYFPLRRAANDTQYVLGRAFLQEAYITVDYEAQRFQLAQAAWEQTAQKSIETILPYNVSQPSTSWTSSTWTTDNANTTGGSGYPGASPSKHSSKISTGVIVGIVVAAVALLVIIAGFLLWRRRSSRKRKAAAEEEREKGSETSNDSDGRGRNEIVYPKAELVGSSPSTFGMTHFDIDNKGLQASRLNTPNTSHGPPSSAGYYGGASSTGSPTTPAPGDGTHSSSRSDTLFSPLTAVPSEADSGREIFEMPGDMPAIREKDGRQLSEKEVLQHRERLFNGVGSTSSTPTTATPTQGTHSSTRRARRVAGNEVVDARTGEALQEHRAFSFEGDDSERELYSSSSS